VVILLFPVVVRSRNYFLWARQVENPRVHLETNKFVVLLLKLVGAFLTASATRVRKNRSAIRGLSNVSTTNCASLCTKWWLANGHAPSYLTTATDVPSRSTLRNAPNGDYVVWNSVKGRSCRCPSSMEPAASANRTQIDALHANFQALVENVLVPGCLL